MTSRHAAACAYDTGCSNIAGAIGACEMLENGAARTRDVSAFLFVKDQDARRIAEQAWDLATDARPIPPALQQSA